VTNDNNALPTLPSLRLVTLGSTQQPAATVASQANLVLTLKLSPTPATIAPQARPVVPPANGVNLAGVVPTPTQVASVTPASAGSTPSVDPVCARFPSLPSCKQG
jgi:heterodisulfide reductase subunit A-like polyferredoxin